MRKIIVIVAMLAAACTPLSQDLPDRFIVVIFGETHTCIRGLTGAHTCTGQPPDTFEVEGLRGRRFECERTIFGRYSCTERWRSVNQTPKDEILR